MEKVTVSTLQRQAQTGRPIVALTCYDTWTARLIDQEAIDLALVGDSLANTRLGYPNTLPVTVEEMLHHVRASARGVRRALLVADLPFHSYETDPRKAAWVAGRFIKEGGAEAVKVEGGRRVGRSIRAILDAGVPVLGHLGLLPQTIHRMGGYRVQGRSRRDAAAILRDARYLQALGVFAVVLEGIPDAVAKRITKALRIPTIGIGAGPHCDGQILVFDDAVGLTAPPLPRFVKQFGQAGKVLRDAVKRYKKEVVGKSFPSVRHGYG